MLDANPLARVWIRPARDVAGREDSGNVGFEEFVDGNATVDSDSGRLRHRSRRFHACAYDYEIGVECRTPAERDFSPGQ